MTAQKSKTEKFKELQPNEKLWKDLYRWNQQEYIRKRLRAIKSLWDGNSRPVTCKSINCEYNSLSVWMDTLIKEGVDEGLRKLVAPKTIKRKEKLTDAQKQAIREMLLKHSPKDYGIDRYIWTGEMILEVIKREWDVALSSSRVYEILQSLGLSFQRAHRDYANADKSKQKSFVKKLKKSAPIWDSRKR